MIHTKTPGRYEKTLLRQPNRQDTIGIQFLSHNHDWPVCVKQV